MGVNMTSSCFWAKKEDKNGMFFWLSLFQHLEDTKNVVGILWDQWLCDGQRKLINTSISSNEKNDGKNLCMFLGAVHDIGKATPAFQAKKSFSNSNDLDCQLIGKLLLNGFEGINDFYTYDMSNTPHNIAGQYLLMSYGVKEDIAVIVGGHHGKTVDKLLDVRDELSAHTSNYFQTEDKNSSVYKKWDTEQRKIFDWALKECGYNNVNDLPKIKQPAQVILLGLLIMADWIVSNDDYFPLINIDESSIVNNKGRYIKGYKKWKKGDLWIPNSNDFIDGDFIKLYKNRFGFKNPKPVQKKMYEVIHNIKNPGIIILEAPMGEGKTEAALVGMEQLSIKTGRSGMFFGLPTQATSNGIFPRILNWLPKTKEDKDDKTQVRLVHSKAYLNKDFSSLSRNMNVDGDVDYNLIVNEWFSGRKTAVLDDFEVGTIDQFLMVSLKQKHLPLRHLGFSKKVVIIDEVHAYDAYMSSYLLQSIKWMGAYGVPVIILSATLPENRRIELMKNYMMGMGVNWKKEEKIKRDNSMKTLTYPLITFNDGDKIYQIRDIEIDNNSQKNIFVNKIDEENLENTVDNLFKRGGVIGIVVNTVARAQRIGRLLSEKFGSEFVEVFHSAFISSERIRKEEELLKTIGKDGKRPERKIIVGTQVIEQSLDIDFDVIISDLAPMDLLIQRVGRLHRHNRKDRNKNHIAPCLFVMGTSNALDFEGGSLSIYGGFLLARTQYYLPDKILIPDDISKLVQNVYKFNHEKGKELFNVENIKYADEELNEKYYGFLGEFYSKIDEKVKSSKEYQIGNPVLKSGYKKNSLEEWLINPDLSSETKAYAQVRDSEDSIEVIALKKFGDGYGTFNEFGDISENIHDKKTIEKIMGNTIKLPLVLTRQYDIDSTIVMLEKYNSNNEKLSEWREILWLKGELGIIFDENNEFIIGKYKMKYSEKYGLSIERI